MTLKLRKSVPLAWVLLVCVTLFAKEISSPLELQFWTTDQTCLVKSETSPQEEFCSLSADQCTAIEQSCGGEGRMSGLLAEQKKVLKSLYKKARQVVHLEEHINFLSKCKEVKFIPKSFQIKTSLPGNQRINQERFDKVSIEAMGDEKIKHANKLNWAKAELDRLFVELSNVFKD